MAAKEEIQQMLLLYQLLQAHAEQLKQQAEVIQKRYVEFEATAQAVKELARMKPENETLVPLASGVFAKAKIMDVQQLLVNVGANVVLAKPAADTLTVLESRKKEIEEMLQRLQKEMEDTVSKLNQMAPELEQAVKEAQDAER